VLQVLMVCCFAQCVLLRTSRTAFNAAHSPRFTRRGLEGCGTVSVCCFNQSINVTPVAIIPEGHQAGHSLMSKERLFKTAASQTERSPREGENQPKTLTSTVL